MQARDNNEESKREGWRSLEEKRKETRHAGGEKERKRTKGRGQKGMSGELQIP